MSRGNNSLYDHNTLLVGGSRVWRSIREQWCIRISGRDEQRRRYEDEILQMQTEHVQTAHEEEYVWMLVGEPLCVDCRGPVVHQVA